MKRTILISAMATITAFIAAFQTGCIKDTDKCDTVVCKNGGTCVNGSCSCPSDYTGANCETKKCEANKTAKVRFMNKTGTSQTYSVVWDGSVITTLGPGATSEYYTVTAGLHTLHFMISNTGTEACTESTPTLVACSSMEYWCTK